MLMPRELRGHIDLRKAIPYRAIVQRLLFLFCLCHFGAVAAQTNVADQWLQSGAVYPPIGSNSVASTNQFATFHAEAVSGQLQITWVPEPDFGSPTHVLVVSSADAPGHWPVRDWRVHSLQPHGQSWQVNVPTDSADAPIIYFALAQSGGATQVSPMRVCRPRALGIEQPSRYFWPFLEGFEQGLGSWRNLSGGGELRISDMAKNGRAALALSVPANHHSASAGTTRLRGWFVQEHGASGFAFWARTASGTGEIRCSLLANAFIDRQAIAAQTNATAVNPHWRRIEVPFSAFARFPLGDLDFVTIEFTAEAGSELLVDDLYLLGRWRFD